MGKDKNFFQGHARFAEFRKSLGLTQQAAADKFGVTRVTWGQCERGNAMPSGEVLSELALLGADVNYILTGELSAASLGSDEKQLLELFRAAPLAVKMAAVGALQGASLAQTTVSQQNHAQGSVQVGYVAGNNKVFKK